MSNLDHLVVGVDGSAGADLALRWAVEQSPRHVTVVHAFSPGLELLAAGFQIDTDPVRAEHRRLLESSWSAPARDAGVPIDTVLVEDNAANALTDISARRHGSAVVIGHQGHRRWSAHHVGETAGRLLHHCDTPVILTSDPTRPEPLAGTVVVGLSRPADPDNPELAWALDVAHRDGLPLHLVTFVEPLVFVDANYAVDMASIHREMSSQMNALADRVRSGPRAIELTTEVRDGEVLRELATVAAERNACLVVVGSHHPGPLGSFAGSVARLLPPLVRCPTAIVPGR